MTPFAPINYGDPEQALSLATKYAQTFPPNLNEHGAMHLYDAIDYCARINRLVLSIITNLSVETLTATFPPVLFTEGPCNTLITQVFIKSRELSEVEEFDKTYPQLKHLNYPRHTPWNNSQFVLDLMQRFPNLEGITDSDNKKIEVIPSELISKLVLNNDFDLALKITKFATPNFFTQIRRTLGGRASDLLWVKWFFETAAKEKGVELPKAEEVSFLAEIYQDEIRDYLTNKLPQLELRPPQQSEEDC